MQRPTAVSQPEKHSHEGLAIPANPAVLLLALPIIQSSDETMLPTIVPSELLGNHCNADLEKMDHRRLVCFNGNIQHVFIDNQKVIHTYK